MSVRGNFGLMKTFSVFLFGCDVKAFFGSQIRDLFFRFLNFELPFQSCRISPSGINF